MKLNTIATVVACFVSIAVCSTFAAESVPVMQAGMAKVDITPQGPVQLINVKEPTEATQVVERLYARALAFGAGSQAVVLVNFDGIGVPATLTERVARELNATTGVPPEQLAICATHAHWAPHLTDLLANIYGGPLPEDHQDRVDAYTDMLADRLVAVAEQALADRQPSHVRWATGRVTFAANRRLETGGQLLRDEKKRLMITWNPAAPVDHALPVMTVQDADSGALRGLHFTYACHNVALTGSAISGFVNSIHGDWAGFAQEELERRHADCIAICTIGCGGDQRPDFCGGVDVAAAHARVIGDEVDRMLDHSEWNGLVGPARIQVDRVELPLEPLPSVAELETLAQDEGLNASSVARAVVARHRLLELRESGLVPDGVPFAAQSWRFRQGPTMVFLTGEVCIDYQLRVKREFGADVWPVAYANATPCYIVSRRMLERGGYEAGNSMFYYGWLRPLQPIAEDIVMQCIARVLDTE